MADTALKSYPNCFGCGQENPIGLRLSFANEGDALVTRFVPREDHQGWPGIVHGGIIATLLYEVLENFSYQQGIVAMMKRMETNLRRPGKTGVEIVAKAWLAGRSEKEMQVSATLTNGDGTLIAEGSAELVILDQRQKIRLGIA